MSKRLLIVIAFLLPLLPLLAFFLLEAGRASNEIAAVKPFEPQSAAQLSVLPEGSEVLVEGRLDAQKTKNLDVLFGAGLWLARKQTQRGAQAAL
jgi:hypothetical protein